MFIVFWCDGNKLGSCDMRQRPGVGHHVRLNGVEYRVDGVTWHPDDNPDEVDLHLIRIAPPKTDKTTE